MPAVSPIGEAYPGVAPALRIASSSAGRSQAAPTAFASFVSFTSMSPRMIATTSSSRAPPSSPAVRNTAFAVRAAGISRNALSSSIVRAPGVATRSSGSGSSGSAGVLAKRAIWRFAE